MRSALAWTAVVIGFAVFAAALLRDWRTRGSGWVKGTADTTAASLYGIGVALFILALVLGL